MTQLYGGSYAVPEDLERDPKGLIELTRDIARDLRAEAVAMGYIPFPGDEYGFRYFNRLANYQPPGQGYVTVEIEVEDR